MMIANATWRNPEDIRTWMTALNVTRAVVVYCVHGRHCVPLQDARLRAAYLEAGFEQWAGEGLAGMTKS